ncbi:unnamed protein product [Effrenium voratum]|nr:unnamed protein product [Effrenium voratum]
MGWESIFVDDLQGSGGAPEGQLMGQSLKEISTALGARATAEAAHTFAGTDAAGAGHHVPGALRAAVPGPGPGGGARARGAPGAAGPARLRGGGGVFGYAGADAVETRAERPPFAPEAGDAGDALRKPAEVGVAVH